MFLPMTTSRLLSGSTKESAAVKLPQLAVYVFKDLYPTFDPDRHTEVDHINGNHKDNRLCNLRPVSHLQNMMLLVKGQNPNVPALRADASHLTVLANDPSLHCVSETRMKQLVQDGDAVVVQTKVFHRAGLVYKRKGATWVPAKPTLLRNEYLTTKLEKKHQYIAPIIARAFVSNPDESACVTFKDGNKHNLAATNLEWTHSGSGKCGGKRGGKRVGKRVRIEYDGKVSEHESILDVSRKYKIDPKTLRTNLKKNASPEKSNWYARHKTPHGNKKYRLVYT